MDSRAGIAVQVVNKGRRPVILRLLGGHDSSGRWSGTYLDHEKGGLRLDEHGRHDFAIEPGRLPPHSLHGGHTMGSKPRHSSRTSRAGTSRSRKTKAKAKAEFKANRPKIQRRPPTDFDALLGRFSAAVSVLATATCSLGLAAEHLPSHPEHDIGEYAITLENGMAALRAVYNELDVAIRELRQ